jgi:hypothetical protein
VGERQMLPRQTKRTETGLEPLVAGVVVEEVPVIVVRSTEPVGVQDGRRSPRMNTPMRFRGLL